jgi:hypothetical protein
MCDWQSKSDPLYRCKVPAEGDSNYCIFHQEVEDKDISKFKVKFYEQINEVGPERVRNRRYNFQGYVFPAGLVLYADPGGMYADEHARRVEKLLLLPKEIDGPLVLTQATIKGPAHFAGATIKGGAIFAGATFEGDAIYAYATFEGDAYFRDATIKGDAHFWGASFEGDADFWHVTFEGATFFAGAKATRLYLGLRRPTILWWEKKREGITLKNWSTGYSFWGFVRRAFEAMEERERADAAYYFEKLWQRRSRLASPGREKFLAILGYPFELVFLRISIAYGTSLVRPLMSWVAVIAFFAGLYGGFPTLIGRTVESIWTLPNWIIALHFSVTTFTTLGLGDIHPTRLLGKALTSVESVLGGVLMALTVVVIARKFMR